MLTNAIAPDKLGGLERYVRELSAVLARRGADVTVLAKRVNVDDLSHEVDSDGVRVVRYSPPRKLDPLFAAKYPRAIWRGVQDALSSLTAGGEPVVHGHFPVPMLPVLARRKPFLYTCHAPVYKELSSERQGTYALPGPTEYAATVGLKSVERQIMRRARQILTLSEFVRDEVRELDHAAGERVTLVPGGVDLSRFRVRAGAPLPRELNRSGPVVFAARRLVARTGVEQLVEGFARVVARIPDAMLVLAGAGTRRDQIVALIDRLGLAGSVTLLGYVSEDELVGWYQAADVAVTPTQELEGFGLSTAEAMACGAVPLVTPVGANEEVVRGLPREVVSASSSADDIGDALVALLSATDVRMRLRGKVVAEHARQFGWDHVADRHLEIYDRLSLSGAS